MAVKGVHLLFYSPQAEALRAALRDLFDWPSVDAGNGWLIFQTPPAELGVHPAAAAHHEISLMCDDLDGTLTDLKSKGVLVRGEPEDRRFGRAVTVVLPGDVELMLYEPSHPTAIDLG